MGPKCSICTCQNRTLVHHTLGWAHLCPVTPPSLLVMSSQNSAGSEPNLCQARRRVSWYPLCSTEDVTGQMGTRVEGEGKLAEEVQSNITSICGSIVQWDRRDSFGKSVNFQTFYVENLYKSDSLLLVEFLVGLFVPFFSLSEHTTDELCEPSLKGL